MADHSVDCELSGFAVRFCGLSPELAERLRREWAAFVIEDSAESPFLELQVESVQRPWTAGAYDPKGMVSRLLPTSATFEMDEGDAEVHTTGAARIRLVTGTGDRAWFTMLNMFRACLAWRLPARNAALVHAAGIVVDERAFVLVGAAGAGKSTFARIAAEAGATVVSDDVVLLDAGGGVTLAAAPLRSTHAVVYRRARWPLAALLLPRHGSPPALQPVGRLLAVAKLTANLPFVADGVECDPRIGAVVERLVAQVDCAELTFAPDPAFLELLRNPS